MEWLEMLEACCWKLEQVPETNLVVSFGCLEVQDRVQFQ
jgi:hypothetical protein